MNNLQIQTLLTLALGQVKNANEIGNDECGLILFWYERLSLNTWHGSKCNWSKCLLIFFRKAILYYKELITYKCEFFFTKWIMWNFYEHIHWCIVIIFAIVNITPLWNANVWVFSRTPFTRKQPFKIQNINLVQQIQELQTKRTKDYYACKKNIYKFKGWVIDLNCTYYYI